MKRIASGPVALVISLLMVALFQPVAFAQGNSSDVEATIMKLEQTWIDAERQNKPENAAQLFAENAVFTDADGATFNKAGELNSMHQVTWETAEDSDMKLVQHGDTVIVTGIFDGKGKSSAGKKVTVSERWTDVWMKTEHGGWQIVASHSSPIEK